MMTKTRTFTTRLLTSLALGLAVASTACQPDLAGAEDAGSLPTADAGADAGSQGTDAGGQGGTDAGGQDADAGQGMADAGFMLPDGGLDLGDGGLVGYEGEAEEGVLCGETLENCGADGVCCVDVSFAGITATCGMDDGDGGQVCEPSALDFRCDDAAEDCGEGAVCCMEFGFGGGLTGSSYCAESCDEGQQTVCTADADCEGGLVCCGAEFSSFSLPLDMGICRDTCDTGA